MSIHAFGLIAKIMVTNYAPKNDRSPTQQEDADIPPNPEFHSRGLSRIRLYVVGVDMMALSSHLYQ